MEDAEMLLARRRRKLALGAIAVLVLVATAVGLATVANRQEAQEAVTADAPAAVQEQRPQGAEAGEGAPGAVEQTPAEEAVSAARKAQGAEAQDFERTLQASLWVADTGDYTVTFDNGTLTETTPAGTFTRPFAITAVEEQGTGATRVVTASLKTDKGDSILSYSAVSDDTGKVLSAGFQCKGLSYAGGYVANPRPTGEVRLENFTQQGAEAFGGDEAAIRAAIEKWCAENAPTATAASWSQVASIDYASQTAQTKFQLNDTAKTMVALVWAANTGELSVEAGV